MSEEARKKISIARMGTRFSDETRARLSTSHMGHPVSIETLTKMSAAHMGHATSLETRAKISSAKMGHVVSPETRGKVSAGNWKGGRIIAMARYHAKRRTLGFIPLNEPFDDCEGHHVDSRYVIYMPHKLHRSVYHRQSDGRGMAEINALAFDFLFKQETTTSPEGLLLPITLSSQTNP